MQRFQWELHDNIRLANKFRKWHLKNSNHYQCYFCAYAILTWCFRAFRLEISHNLINYRFLWRIWLIDQEWEYHFDPSLKQKKLKNLIIKPLLLIPEIKKKLSSKNSFNLIIFVFKRQVLYKTPGINNKILRLIVFFFYNQKLTLYFSSAWIKAFIEFVVAK